jgi:hypothetical protein
MWLFQDVKKSVLLMNEILVKVKEQYVDKLNDLLMSNFSVIPFLFNHYQVYKVSEVTKTLFISGYEAEYEYCIEGLELPITFVFAIGDLIVKKDRNIYFPQLIFNKIKDETIDK